MITIGTQDLDCGQLQIELEMSTLLSATSKSKLEINLDISTSEILYEESR